MNNKVKQFIGAVGMGMLISSGLSELLNNPHVLFAIGWILMFFTYGFDIFIIKRRKFVKRNTEKNSGEVVKHNRDDELRKKVKL